MISVPDRNVQVAAVDLFCGAGGLTYGLEQSGMNVATSVDNEPSVRHAIESNTSSEFVQADIGALARNPERVNRMWPADADVKVLGGGPPCQPHTRLNKQNPEEHEKWDLVRTFITLAEETDPDVVVMENVPGIERNGMFEELLGRLQQAGFHVTWKVLDGPEYGVPQSRSRMFTFGSKAAPTTPPEPTHPEDPRTVRDVIGDLPQIDAGEIHPDDRLHRSQGLADANLKRIQASEPGGTWRDWPDELKLKSQKEGTATSVSVYGRMKWDLVGPTITTQFYNYGTGRYGHPEQNRALSLREGAMLQTFPRDFEFVPPDEELNIRPTARKIGNAVPPLLAERVGSAVINHTLEGHEQKSIPEFC